MEGASLKSRFVQPWTSVVAGWSRWFSKPFFVANLDFAFLTTKWHAFFSEMEPNLDLWSGKIDALLPIFYACVVFTAIRAFKNEKLHFLPLNWRFCSVISAWTLQNLYRQKALLTSFHMSQLLTQLDAYWLRKMRAITNKRRPENLQLNCVRRRRFTT